MHGLILCVFALWWNLIICTSAGANIYTVASVNDEVISNLDLENRINFISTINDIPITDGVFGLQLRDKALQQLIDERLLFQEAKKLGIRVSEYELAVALSKYEAAFSDDLKTYTQNHHLDYDSIVRSIESKLLWDKILTDQILPLVMVNSDEIDDLKQQIYMHGSVKFVTFQEIVVLPYTMTREEAIILSKKLQNNDNRQELKLTYPNLSFSDKKTSANMESMPRALLQLIENASDGEIIEPVPIKSGYLIVRVLDKITIPNSLADSTVLIKQAQIKSAEEKMIMPELIRLKKEKGDVCTGFDKLVQKLGLLNSTEMETKVRDLDPHIQQILQNMKVGEATEIIDNEQEPRVLLLCNIVNSDVDDSKSFRQKIYEDKIQKQSQQFLNQIRSSALIKTEDLSQLKF